jgi:hypothetical protein
MNVQSIQAQDLNIANTFQAFYTVPDYQREYVWKTEQVDQLLNDIYAEFSGSDVAAAPEYFIGSIVVCPGKDDVFELIDGQQRMTTLFLVLCAIRNRLQELGQSPSTAIANQIAAETVDITGQAVFRYRLELQYEDSGDVLELIAKAETPQNPTSTLSIANIVNALQAIREFLVAQFADDIVAVRGFYGYLNNKVKLIRIQTEDVAKALKIFETINDRGVGLNSMDLLKNLLFMKAKPEQFSKLRDSWKALQDTIFEMGEKPLRFLRYFIFSRYQVDQLREDQIYSWLVKNESLCEYASSPLRFAEELRSAALAYQNFLSGRDQKGQESPVLENIQLLGGNAARQHLILLLAGRHLPSNLFERLCNEVENLFFVYVITREPTRDFERNFARWAVDVRGVTSQVELDAVIEKRFTPAKNELSARFDDAFRRLTSDDVQKYRLRYILAKLTQRVDLDGFGIQQGTKWLGRYAGNDFEIEHIFPQNPNEEATVEFGDLVAPNISSRLGNLLLVEKSINASLGNKPFSQKASIYRHSQVLLTRTLSETPEIGRDTKIDAAVAPFRPFKAWSADSIAARQDQLVALARRAWNMPADRNS